MIRDGKEQTLTVKLEELPDENKPQAIAESPVRNRLGLLVGELSGDQRRKSDQGVLVKDVHEGPAATRRVPGGDVITRLNNVEVTTVANLPIWLKTCPRVGQFQCSSSVITARCFWR